MDINKKIKILADAAKYDASCASGGSTKNRKGQGLGSVEKTGICHSYTPDGRCISLLKILLTNYCIFDCQYCVNRVSSNVERARFSIEEVVNLTLDFYRRNYIEGLFLSSGIIRDPDYTMEQMIEVAKTLRQTHSFRGYIHLKTIPNAQQILVNAAGLYADRLSVNIELPTAVDLKNLAPEKNRVALEKNMADIDHKRQEITADKKNGMKAPLFIPAGQTTQMIIGATASSDKIILQTAAHLYKNYQLRRVYYSAYSPIPHADARLPSILPPLLREHRLYQADWLFRFYGFDINEIISEENPNLDIDVDPKVSWALRHPDFFPVNINKADKNDLLRIPGIGIKTVESILKNRRYHHLTVADLKTLRVAFNRAKYFILTADYQPKESFNSVKQFIKKSSNTFTQIPLDL